MQLASGSHISRTYSRFVDLLGIRTDLKGAFDSPHTLDVGSERYLGHNLGWSLACSRRGCGLAPLSNSIGSGSSHLCDYQRRGRLPRDRPDAGNVQETRSKEISPLNPFILPRLAD